MDGVWGHGRPGTLPGGSYSEAYGINDLGQVVGWSQTASGARHAFLWTAQGGMIDLGTLGGAESVAYAINGLGQVVGYSYTASGEVRAFLWTAGGGMADLGTLPSGAYSDAWGINNLGQVVGWGYNASWQERAFLWTAQGGMADLGTLGGAYSFAWGINDLGQVVGESSTVSGAFHATLWQTAPPVPPTPQEQIDSLTDEVAALANSNVLNNGLANSLTAKLQNALQSLNQGNVGASVNQLQAFINQVQALINAGKLTPGQGQPLIDAANAIISQLNG